MTEAKKTLTYLQLRIMSILWDCGDATVAEVQEALKSEKELARTTVATLIARLEKHGYISHRKTERARHYYPLVKQKEIQESMVSELVDTLFQGKRSGLVSHLLSSRKVKSEDIEEVIKMIKEKQEKKKDDV